MRRRRLSLRRHCLEISQGSVEIRSPGEAGFTAAEDGAELAPGDRLRLVEGATAAVIFFEDSVVLLSEGADVTIEQLSGSRESGRSNLQILQAAGRTLHRVSKLVDTESSYMLRTITSIGVVRGTKFIVYQTTDGTNWKSVEGRIGVAGESGRETLVSGGTSSDVPADGDPSPPVIDPPAPEERQQLDELDSIAEEPAPPPPPRKDPDQSTPVAGPTPTPSPTSTPQPTAAPEPEPAATPVPTSAPAVTPTPVPTTSLASPDPAGTVGQHTSLQLDSSGFPVISYFHGTDNTLNVVHCTDANCTTAPTSYTGDATSGAGRWSSLDLNASGYPVMSNYDLPSTDLNVVTCSDANCTTSPRAMAVDVTASDVGSYSSMVLDGSGNRVISHYDATAGDLKVTLCTVANRTMNGTVSLDTTNDNGKWTSIALDGSGFPVVSYYDATNGDLKLPHCGDATCSTGNTIATVDSTGVVGAYTSLQLDSSGYPVISYRDQTNADLKLAHCVSTTCL